MHRFLREFITEWRRLELPVKDGALVAAVSGGADSVSLLLALHQLREKKKLSLKIIVAHFNHGLREGDSDMDEKFAAKLAKKLGHQFEPGLWQRAPGGKKENLEQAARAARYEFLGNIADKHGAFAVLTGHTINDQAETFLLRLVRGSGFDGLAGMRPVRRLAPGKKTLLARPLLNWAKRGDTEEFCREAKIEYRTDRMNHDNAFARVKVRKKLIPLLESMNPAIVSGLARTAVSVQDEIDDLNRSAVSQLKRITELNTGALDVKALRELPAPQRARVLREWLLRQRGSLRRLDREHFNALERLILNGAGGKTAELPGKAAVSISKGRLIFRKT